MNCMHMCSRIAHTLTHPNHNIHPKLKKKKNIQSRLCLICDDPRIYVFIKGIIQNMYIHICMYACINVYLLKENE